ncbi:hypothetical protein MMPV_002766 [Pyropia vietnamensis]
MGVTRQHFLGPAFDAHRYERARLQPFGGGHPQPATPPATRASLPPLLAPFNGKVCLWDIRGRPPPPSPTPPAAAAPTAPTATTVATATSASFSLCTSPSRRASPEPPASDVTSAHPSPQARPSSPAGRSEVTAAPPRPAPSRPWRANPSTSRWVPPTPSPTAPRSRPVGVRKPRAPKPKVAGQSRYWTPSEHRLFVEALSLYGTKDLKSIAAHVSTRNQTQVRTHAQKWSMRLVREAKRACLGRADMQALVDAATAAAATAAAGSTNLSTGSPSPVSRPTASTGRQPFGSGGGGETRGGEYDGGGGDGAGGGGAVSGEVDVDSIGSKCSVPAQCGMALLCLVGQDTMPAAGASVE